MIILNCSRCGHEIEVGESMRDMQIRCARCGHQLSAKSGQDASRTEIRATPILFGEAITGQADADETLFPRPTSEARSFQFLSPPKEPTELGWLGHYRVLRLLGQGGMGIVFEAFDTNLHRPIALKVMKPEFAQDQSSRERFLREARALAAVRSDHVVTVFEVGQRNNVPFLAMEFLQGEPLDHWLKLRGRPTMREITRLGIQIARGLAAAHECGLIHRDIKPGNIFLEGIRRASEVAVHAPDVATMDTVVQARPPLLGSSPLPEGCRVKILDFGLARVAGAPSQLTDPGLVAGTPAYMAPEQVDGREISYRADLFALGCILYEFATGERAFTGPSSLAILMAVATKQPTPPRELNPDMPPLLAKLVLQLLAKKPEERPVTARTVAAALEDIGSTLTEPTQPRNRKETPWQLVIGAVLVGIALTVGLGWLAFALLN